MLDLRADLLEGQTEAFGGYVDAGDALGGFFRQVFVALPQYYEIPAWQGYIGDQIARYEAAICHGFSLGGSLVGGVVVLALVMIGFVALWRDRAVAGATRWLIGVWALAMLVTTALLTPLEWQRYYLPAYPAVGLVAGIWGCVGISDDQNARVVGAQRAAPLHNTRPVGSYNPASADDNWRCTVLVLKCRQTSPTPSRSAARFCSICSTYCWSA